MGFFSLKTGAAFSKIFRVELKEFKIANVSIEEQSWRLEDLKAGQIDLLLINLKNVSERPVHHN